MRGPIRGMVNNLCVELKNEFCQGEQPEKQEKEYSGWPCKNIVNAKFSMPEKEGAGVSHGRGNDLIIGVNISCKHEVKAAKLGRMIPWIKPENQNVIGWVKGLPLMRYCR